MNDQLPVEGAPQTRREAKRRMRRRRRPRNKFLAFLLDIAVVLVIAIVASWAVRTFLFRSFYVPSESMVSTLEVNDRIIVNNLYPSVFSLERGDVVVFKDPGGWLTEPTTPAVTNPIQAVGMAWRPCLASGHRSRTNILSSASSGCPATG